MPKLTTACALLLVLCATACSHPEPPATDKPPEPQAAAAVQADASAQPRGALTKAIQSPIDKAKGVEDTVLDAAEKQKAEIDAQTGG